MNRNILQALALLPLLALLLTSCVRSASTFSPQPDTVSEAPSPTPGQIPYPLEPASTWIYEYRTGNATWIVTETILTVEQTRGLQIATAERNTIQTSGPLNAPAPPTLSSKQIWYILRGAELYSQTTPPDLQEFPQNAHLELLFPPESVPCWPSDNPFGPLELGSPGCRYINATLATYPTRAGTFENCLELLTPAETGLATDIFCPNLGFVSGKFEPDDGSEGYEYNLTGYSLPLP